MKPERLWGSFLCPYSSAERRASFEENDNWNSGSGNVEHLTVLSLLWLLSRHAAMGILIASMMCFAGALTEVGQSGRLSPLTLIVMRKAALISIATT